MPIPPRARCSRSTTRCRRRPRTACRYAATCRARATTGASIPTRIPALRASFRARADVPGYALASAPKAAAYHPHGRVFVTTAAASQRAAEEQALAACNGDPERKGADGGCFLYAVGNKVILPQRITGPRPPAGSIGEAISMLAVDRNLSANYAADSAQQGAGDRARKRPHVPLGRRAVRRGGGTR